MNTAVVLTFMLGGLTAEPDAVGSDPNKIRALFRTVAGDLVFELDYGLAPNTVEKICELIAAKAYDGTHFHRIEPGFVIQLSNAEDRLTPLNADQLGRIQKLRLENTGGRHRKGVLSMARWDDDPNSATTSFSIVQGAAKHLDGKYTIFGEMTHGWDVLAEFQNVPRTGNKPNTRLTVIEARLLRPGEPLPAMDVKPVDLTATPTGLTMPLADKSVVTSVCVGVLVLFGVLHVSLSGRIAPARLRSINLLGVFVGAFLLLILVTPIAHVVPVVGLGLFCGLIGLFKLMGQFESAA